MENTFTKSESIENITKALVEFHKAVKPIKKDGENPFLKNKYATLDAIISGTGEHLIANGLVCSQFPTGENKLVTVLMHTSGEFLESTATMTPKENTPQGQGSAITYMRRYSYSAILGLATEHDDDGHAASKVVTKEEVKKVDSLFEKAKKNLSKSVDESNLNDYRVKISKSDKYSDEQKKELIEVIDAQIKKVTKDKKAK